MRTRWPCRASPQTGAADDESAYHSPALPALSVALAGAQTMGAAAVSMQAPTLDGNGRLATSSRRMPMSPTRSKRCNRT